MLNLPVRTLDEVKALILEKAKEHAPLTDEDEWLYESLERQALIAIFEYLYRSGFQIEGVDLGRLLEHWYDEDNEEDEEEEEIAVMPILFDLQLRMTHDGMEGHIPIPDEIKELFQFYSQSFWPEAYEAEEQD